MSMMANDDVQHRLSEIKRLYDCCHTTPHDPSTDLNAQILYKLNGLFGGHNASHHQSYKFSESNTKSLIDILVHIGNVYDGRDGKQLNNFMLFTNVVKQVAEKSMALSNGTDVNWFFSYFLSKILMFYANQQQYRMDVDNLVDLYHCLGALVYKNACYLSKSNLDKLLNSERMGILNHLIDESSRVSKNERLFVINVQLLYNLTLQSDDDNPMTIDDSAKLKCLRLLIRVLGLPYIVNFNETVYSKILVKCLQGLENLIICANILPTDAVTDILSIVKTLQFYGLHLHNIKQTTRHIAQLKPSDIHIPLASSHQANNDNSDMDINSFNNSNNSGTMAAVSIRKKRYTKKSTTSQRVNVHAYSSTGKQHQQSTLGNTASMDAAKLPPLIEYNKTNDNFMIRLQHSHLSSATTTSESDNSDMEMATANDVKNRFFLEKCNAKVREASLNVLQIAFQTLDKRTILNYWNSFIPDDDDGNRFTLITSIELDHSPKIRLLAIKTLNTFIECCAKNLFQLAADDHHQGQQQQQQQHQQSFISKSQIFSSVLKKLYAQIEGLIRNENFLINLNELLVTLTMLIKNTHFKRLSFGFITQLIGFLYAYLWHTDLNVRIKCVNAYCMLIQVAQLNFEIYLSINLNKYEPVDETKLAGILATTTASNNSTIAKANSDFHSRFQVTISPVTYFYNDCQNSIHTNFESFVNTLDTLVKTEQLDVDAFKLMSIDNDKQGGLLYKLAHLDDYKTGLLYLPMSTSWLIKYCVQTILTTCCSPNETMLRITCVNLLCSLCKHYFYLIRETFDDMEAILIRNLSINCCDGQGDQHDEVLATLKLFEELSRCMATRTLRTLSVDLNRCVKLWSNILNNSHLIGKYLVDERNYLLSSQACDVLASIGMDIFENLLINKRYLIITCLLNLTKSDSSNLVRSASIRALGVYVTFQLLKEDNNFLDDISHTIINLLYNDSNNLVKQKCAWSFANFTEILLENKSANGPSHEYLNHNLYFRLVKCSVDVCMRESDKIKSYLVRTLGNLLNYLDENLMHQKVDNNIDSINGHVTNAVKQLIACKNTKMLKVKWNLCYSIGICIRNSSVLSRPEWQHDLYSTLIDLFKNETNYKVRINACCAFLQYTIKPPRQYGFNDFYCELWVHLMENFFKVFNTNENYELQHKYLLIKQMCKFLTYLCKYLQVGDLIVIDRALVGLMAPRVADDTAIETNQSLYANKSECKQIKYHFGNYILDIHSNSETYKTEIQLYNDALNQLNVTSINMADEQSVDAFQGFLTSVLRRDTHGDACSPMAATYDTSDICFSLQTYPFEKVWL